MVRSDVRPDLCPATKVPSPRSTTTSASNFFTNLHARTVARTHAQTPQRSGHPHVREFRRLKGQKIRKEIEYLTFLNEPRIIFDYSILLWTR